MMRRNTVSAWTKYTGCPKKVSIKNFSSDQLSTLITSVLISPYPVDLYVLFDLSFVILSCLKKI